jgi:AraC family transcriptional regulator
MKEPCRAQEAFYGSTSAKRRVNDLVLIDSRHRAGENIARHSHECAYFCFNHGGVYSETYGRRTRICRPGMVVFHPVGEVHCEIHESDVASLNVEIDAIWLHRMLEFAGPLDQPVEFHDDVVARAGAQLLYEVGRSDPDSALAIESLTWEVLAQATLPQRPLAHAQKPHWLLSAQEFLESNPRDSFGLSHLGADLGVHPVHLAATFRRFFGCSVGEYLRRVRLREARRKLADPQLSLAEVAAATGFADQSHLTRTFKRLCGMTPREYRTFLQFKTC